MPLIAGLITISTNPKRSLDRYALPPPPEYIVSPKKCDRGYDVRPTTQPHTHLGNEDYRWAMRNCVCAADLADLAKRPCGWRSGVTGPGRNQFNLPHKNRHASLIGLFLRAIPIPPLFGGFFFCVLFVVRVDPVCLSVCLFFRGMKKVSW